MAQLDKVKEEIGWLKVVFSLLVAVDFSLIGWCTQHFGTAPPLLFWVAIIVVAIVSWSIITLSKQAYSKIDKLGDL